MYFAWLQFLITDPSLPNTHYVEGETFADNSLRKSANCNYSSCCFIAISSTNQTHVAVFDNTAGGFVVTAWFRSDIERFFNMFWQNIPLNRWLPLSPQNKLFADKKVVNYEDSLDCPFSRTRRFVAYMEVIKSKFSRVMMANLVQNLRKSVLSCFSGSLSSFRIFDSLCIRG